MESLHPARPNSNVVRPLLRENPQAATVLIGINYYASPAVSERHARAFLGQPANGRCFIFCHFHFLSFTHEFPNSPKIRADNVGPRQNM
ncbi:hypothetical protein G3O06_01855 [Burkholderia sp. Ac-20345]|uniref:hypothetical protein n=1 Tax=Burkholderia sp. Ac-20345 TaxID=2703891 RepID=UPI00197B9C12|nr:hypothetical protein [Burkholderia sp. Ac-20345]MBN3776307.1 hypothetical protein [Burkholderia sp. Ac-20345]